MGEAKRRKVLDPTFGQEHVDKAVVKRMLRRFDDYTCGDPIEPQEAAAAAVVMLMLEGFDRETAIEWASFVGAGMVIFHFDPIDRLTSKPTLIGLTRSLRSGPSGWKCWGFEDTDRCHLFVHPAFVEDFKLLEGTAIPGAEPCRELTPLLLR